MRQNPGGSSTCNLIMTRVDRRDVRSNRLAVWLVSLVATLLSTPAKAEGGGAPQMQSSEPPQVRVVWREQLHGGVEHSSGAAQARQLARLPTDQFEFANGIYKSSRSRIQLKVPRILDETQVDVREAVTLVRGDGTPATTHVMFDPGGASIVGNLEAPVRAVVVTRLRDDRPKDAEGILERLDGGAQGRDEYARTGWEYQRMQTSLGPALARTIRNRANGARFPYQMAVLRDATATTYGMTRYVLVGTDSLIELSQIYPCKMKPDAVCKQGATDAMDRFVGGVQMFLMYPEGAHQSSPASERTR
jgi:hypothetical protein